MKRFCISGLILLGSAAWGPIAAQAQSAPYGAMLVPWNSAAPGSSGIQPSGYFSDSTVGSNTAPSGGAFEKTGSRSGFNEAVCAAPLGEDFDTCCDGCNRKWYATASALVMTRNRAPAFWLTHRADDNFNLLMNSENARADWTGGGQVTLGHAWGGTCGPAIAFTYWGLSPMNGFASVSDNTGIPATALSSTLDWTAVTVNGNPATLFFDNAQQQAVWRRDRADNFELNLQSSPYTVNSLQIAALAGFRSFRFSENLTYGSASFGNSFVSNGGADAAYLNINCRNVLLGGQVGAVINSFMTNRLTFFVVPKVGIYGNQMNNVTQVYGGSTPNAPDVFFTTQKSDVSVLSELDTGFSWAFHPNWRLNYGYRVISVNNVSLADNQFGAFGHVEQSGSVIIHGAFIGLGWMF